MTAHSPKGHRKWTDPRVFICREHNPPRPRGHGKWLKLDKEEWKPRHISMGEVRT